MRWCTPEDLAAAQVQIVAYAFALHLTGHYTDHQTKPTQGQNGWGQIGRPIKGTRCRIVDIRSAGFWSCRETEGPMRGLLTLTLIFAGTAAAAHPGHWADIAGHDHWIAGAAIGLAGLAAIWGALKGKKAQEDAEPEEEMEEEAA